MTLVTHKDKNGKSVARHMGGWVRQHEDSRDFKLQIPRFLTVQHLLPPKVDNSPNLSAIRDQGQLGSCTAHAVSGAVEPFLAQGQTAASAPTQLSTLFQYYETRKLEGTIEEDSGASIRDAIKAAALAGCAPESMYPYLPERFAQTPPAKVSQRAAKHRISSYHSIANGDLNTMKAALALHDTIVIVFGFTVYSGFMGQAVAKSGKLNMPAKGETVEGGHAVDIVGYDDASKRVLVRNSWGDNWGMAGYFTMPYAYLQDSNLSSDFWVIDACPKVL